MGTLLGWDSGRVLDLYFRTTDDADAGASISGTLDAVKEWSDAGRLPVVEVTNQVIPQGAGVFGDIGIPLGHGLILGADLPGSHALIVKPDGSWWSWGEPFNPADWPDMVIDEAWAVLP